MVKKREVKRKKVAKEKKTIFTKKVRGEVFKGVVFCPICKEKESLGSISDYGVSGDNYYFEVPCNKCKVTVKYLADGNFKAIDYEKEESKVEDVEAVVVNGFKFKI